MSGDPCGLSGRFLASSLCIQKFRPPRQGFDGQCRSAAGRNDRDAVYPPVFAIADGFCCGLSGIEAETDKLSLDDSRVESYLRKFFYPLGHESFFADLPGVLRRVADILEKTKA